MAVDTRDRRASCIGNSLPSLFVLPNPDGEVLNPGDRQQMCWTYRGITVAIVIVSIGVGHPRRHVPAPLPRWLADRQEKHREFDALMDENYERIENKLAEDDLRYRAQGRVLSRIETNEEELIRSAANAITSQVNLEMGKIKQEELQAQEDERRAKINRTRRKNLRKARRKLKRMRSKR